MPSDFTFEVRVEGPGGPIILRRTSDPAEAEHSFVELLDEQGLLTPSTLRTLLRQVRHGADLQVIDNNTLITLQKVRTSGRTERNTP